MKEIQFSCRRCDHQLFIEEKEGWVKKVTKKECPNCGEESYENWTLVGYGNYKKFVEGS